MSSTTSFVELLSGATNEFIHQQTPTSSSTTMNQAPARPISSNGGLRPKFKSITPPSLPISSPSFSPSSYFSIPAGLSPAEFLDSPVLLSSSTILASPTTGAFPLQQSNWKFSDHSQPSSDFFFQTNMNSSAPNAPMGSLLNGNYSENNKASSELSSEKLQSTSSELPNLQQNSEANHDGLPSDYDQAPQTVNGTSTNDGYNWRKYGQKQVKASENPRSYYKCTYPNCPTKKKVEKSLEGHITEIVYKGTHSHPKPLSTRRNSSSSQTNSQAPLASDASDHSYGVRSGTQIESVNTPDNSSVSFGDDEADFSSQRSTVDELDDTEPGTKRLKKEAETESIVATGNRTVREPRVVVQTPSDIDILDDGYRWRKYGQKVVKGNPNPRSYYKCTTAGCSVRKHVERAAHDLRTVVTTYEGKHNHDVPAARGSHNINNRPQMPQMYGGIATTNQFMMGNQGNHYNAQRMPNTGNPAQLTLEMLQAQGGYGFPGVNPLMYQLQRHGDGGLPETKAEPRDDSFVESLLS